MSNAEEFQKLLSSEDPSMAARLLRDAVASSTTSAADAKHTKIADSRLIQRSFYGSDGRLLRIPPPDYPLPPLNMPLSDIHEPHPNDVLCGRGGGTNNHAGNEKFRDLVNSQKVLYLHSCKRDKPFVSRGIVRAVRAQLPPGRFLQKNDKTGLWFDIGDQKAREKTSQALREGAPDIRREITTNLGVASHVQGIFPPPPLDCGPGAVFSPPPPLSNNVPPVPRNPAAITDSFAQNEMQRHMQNVRIAEAAIRDNASNGGNVPHQESKEGGTAVNNLIRPVSKDSPRRLVLPDAAPPIDLQQQLRDEIQPIKRPTPTAIPEDALNNMCVKASMSMRQNALRLEHSGMPIIQFPADIATETTARFGGFNPPVAGFGSTQPILPTGSANMFATGAFGRNGRLGNPSLPSLPGTALGNVLNAPATSVSVPALERDIAQATQAVRESNRNVRSRMHDLPNMRASQLANMMKLQEKMGHQPPPLTEDMARRLVLAETVSQKMANGTATGQLRKAEERAGLYLDAGLMGIDPDEMASLLAKGFVEEEIILNFHNADSTRNGNETESTKGSAIASHDSKRKAGSLEMTILDGKLKKPKFETWTQNTPIGKRIREALVAIGAL